MGSESARPGRSSTSRCLVLAAVLPPLVIALGVVAGWFLVHPYYRSDWLTHTAPLMIASAVIAAGALGVGLWTRARPGPSAAVTLTLHLLACIVVFVVKAPLFLG